MRELQLGLKLYLISRKIVVLLFSSNSILLRGYFQKKKNPIIIVILTVGGGEGQWRKEQRVEKKSMQGLVLEPVTYCTVCKASVPAATGDTRNKIHQDW